MDLIYKEEAYRVIGACFEVYNGMGCGFLEAVYQECLEMELEALQIVFVPKPVLDLAYKGRILQQKYVPDLLCFGKIVVELKSVSAIVDEHRAQVHNYLRATGHRLGLLVNFGSHPDLYFERIVR